MVPYLLLILLLTVAVEASHEIVPAEMHWNKMLPDTPMPGAIKDFLHPLIINAASDKRAGYIAILEKDMLPGTKVTMHFMRTTAGLGPTFLPRQAAASIPFSSAKISSILAQLSVRYPNSFRAEGINQTLHECEMPPADGETKYCATSLESMIEYATAILGTRKVSALSTIMSKEGAPRQEYAITRPDGVRKLSGPNFVACHARKYPYAVFYCHMTRGVTAYQASMVGEDGTRVEAVATCHTKIVGPDSQSYLGPGGHSIEPGTTPVCHFLPQDHIVWGTVN